MTHHFGVLIPSANTTVETEYTRHLPHSLQAHFARLGRVQDLVFSPSNDDDLAYQSKLLGTAKVEIIALTQTSASMYADDYDVTATTHMTQNSGTASFTSAPAIGRAIKAFGAKTIALVSPYSEDVMKRTKHYYEARYGVTVKGTAAFAATDSYAISTLSEHNATEAFARIDAPEIEVMVVPGGNFPTMGFIADWERTLGKPVITTNQVVVWAAMLAMGVKEPLRGLGRLLEELPNG
jgi:maleate isomerase